MNLSQILGIIAGKDCELRRKEELACELWETFLALWSVKLRIIWSVKLELSGRLGLRLWFSETRLVAWEARVLVWVIVCEMWDETSDCDTRIMIYETRLWSLKLSLSVRRELWSVGLSVIWDSVHGLRLGYWFVRSDLWSESILVKCENRLVFWE